MAIFNLAPYAFRPSIITQLPTKVGTLTLDTLGWLRTDSKQAAIALAVAVGLYFAFFGLRWLLVRLLGESFPVTHWRGFMRRVVRRTRSPFIAALSAWLVTHVVAPPGLVSHAVDFVFTIAFAIQGALWVRELLLALVERRAANAEDNDSFESAVTIIRVLVNVLVWALALILILDNLGVNVTALVAGLGVGGIAIGLAAQGIFGDLFAALAILFDRPFRVGDTISYGGNTGSVEAIGLKTTRVRALSGEQLIVSNAKLLDQQISNLRRIEERRVVTTIGVIYQTTPDQLEAIPTVIEAIIQARPRLRFDRVHFVQFGASSLDFEIVYFITEPALLSMMDERQAVGLAILRRFAELGIEFAYPTQTTFTAAPDGRMIDPRMMQPAAEASGAEGGDQPLGIASPRSAAGTDR
jgi:small-conductance mechanosensitive channel